MGAPDANGKKVFWSRGNGWAIAAMADVLQTLPPGDARGAKYRDVLVAMAGRLRTLQGADGMWRRSLLDTPLYPQPETSGTALITYALGYGVEAGLLDRATYVPVIARAWKGLSTIAEQPSGFVTGCRLEGDRPDGTLYTATAPRTPATATSPGTVTADSPPFCVGSFLLAGSAVARLASAESTGRPVTASAQQTGAEASRAVDGDVTTRWTASGFPQTLTVDLGAGHRASNVTLVPTADRAYRYRVETSVDGVQWTLALDRSTNTATGSRSDAFPAGTVGLRYARLTVLGATGTTSTSIQEFSVHDRYRPRTNLAHRAPVAGTTTAAGSAAANAVDGVTSTAWASAAKPTATGPQRLRVDLGAPRAFDTVSVWSRAGSGPAAVQVQSSPTAPPGRRSPPPRCRTPRDRTSCCCPRRPPAGCGSSRRPATAPPASASPSSRCCPPGEPNRRARRRVLARHPPGSAAA
nr:glycoside hydrolase family 88 protein [Angustibacter aerolatus]